MNRAVSSLVLTMSLAGSAQAADRANGAPRLEQRPRPTLLAAEDDVLADDDKKPQADDGTVLPDEEVKAGGTVLGDSVGGATGFVFKQGFYTQSDLGGFFVIGNALGSPTGFTAPKETCPDGTPGGGRPCSPTTTSNLQPYIGLSVGYDITQWLGVQVSYGTGFVAAGAIYDDSPQNPRDYGLTTLNLAVVGSFYAFDRLAIMGKLMGGGALISPEPSPDEPTIGGNAGVGVGIRYATLLPDVFVGLDGNVNVAFIPASSGPLVIIPGVSFAPVIKYVF
jgi:hypothetical protein